MQDSECIELLRWMLPRLSLRWAGFRRVRKQVCKRVSRRLKELGLEDAGAYRRYLREHPEEWSVADSLCRITISRFCRDRGVFSFLGSDVLPELGARAIERGETTLRAWSVGCASGEEPYSLALVWNFLVADRFPDLRLQILGTEVDRILVHRAQSACYPGGCLRDLPAQWREKAFERSEDEFCLRAAFKTQIRFQLHDVRSEPLDGRFDLVLCRNLAFTYFDEGLQFMTTQHLAASLRESGALILGSHEQLPAEASGFSLWSAKHRVYRKHS